MGEVKKTNRILGLQSTIVMPRQSVVLQMEVRDVHCVKPNSLLGGSENHTQNPLGFPQTTPRGARALRLNPVPAVGFK